MMFVGELQRLSVLTLTHWSEVNLPEHERPSPAKPSLQVQLCTPTVLMHLAFTSQLWLPVMHSSISRLCTNDWKRDFLAYGTVQKKMLWYSKWSPGVLFCLKLRSNQQQQNVNYTQNNIELTYKVIVNNLLSTCHNKPKLPFHSHLDPTSTCC